MDGCLLFVGDVCSSVVQRIWNERWILSKTWVYAEGTFHCRCEMVRRNNGAHENVRSLLHLSVTLYWNESQVFTQNCETYRTEVLRLRKKSLNLQV